MCFSGSKRNSRIEFQVLPGSASGDFKFTFGFKTSSNNSIIFYASNRSHQDYITFYIKDGKVRLQFVILFAIFINFSFQLLLGCKKGNLKVITSINTEMVD